MGYAQARQSSRDSIPVVDITPLRDGSNPHLVAQQLHAASKNLGFIYIKGHGIPPALINDASARAFEFFRASDEVKRSVLISGKHRGWLKPGASKMQDEVPADLKESFIWGIEDDQGNTPDDHPLRGPNQWPASVPALQPLAIDYFRHAHTVAMHLMRGFALGLNLDEDFFLRSCNTPMSRLSLIHI